MAVVQTTYPDIHDFPYVAGQVVNPQTCDIDSLVVNGTDAIPFGRAVQESTATGADVQRDVELGIATNKFRGISVMDERLRASQGTSFGSGDVIPVLWRGDIAVIADGAVTAGNDVVAATVAVTTGNDQEVEGGLSTRAADATHLLISGARWMTTAAKGSVAVVRLAGPVPAA